MASQTPVLYCVRGEVALSLIEETHVETPRGGEMAQVEAPLPPPHIHLHSSPP